MVIRKAVVRKTVGLDRVDLENVKIVLGHHDKLWYTKRQITEPRPQPQADMLWVQGGKYGLLENHNNETDFVDPDSEELGDIDHAPLLEWN